MAHAKMSERQKKLLHVGKADCEKCRIYRMCHEPQKNLVPKWVQGCSYFVEEESAK